MRHFWGESKKKKKKRENDGKKRALTKIRCVFRSQRCPTMKRLGSFWSSSGWSRPSKVSKQHYVRPCGSKYWTLSRFEHPLVATCRNNTSQYWQDSRSLASTLHNCITLFLNCITAPIMWVKVCPPSKWVGPDPKPGETRLPVVLCHTWPSYPVVPFPSRGPALPSELRKQDETLAAFAAVAPPNRPTSTHRSSLNVVERSRSLAAGAAGRASWVFCGVSRSCGGSERTVFRRTRRQSLLLQPRQVPGVGSGRASLSRTSHHSLYIWTCCFFLRICCSWCICFSPSSACTKNAFMLNKVFKLLIFLY